MKNFLRKERYLYGPAIPLLNSGNWNPDLHPRNSIGEFTYTDGGLHGRSPWSSKHPNSRPIPKSKPGAKGSVQSAIQGALALPINRNTDRNNGTPTNPYFSHYGYDSDIYKDTYSNQLHTGKFGALGPYSLAISDNVAIANGLVPRAPVYVNGKYMGNYDDRAPEDNTIDVYDPDNMAGSQNWGGTVIGGASVSSSP